LTKVKDTNALQSISDVAGRGEKAEQQAGLMKTVMHTMSVCFSKIDEYSDLWARRRRSVLPKPRPTTCPSETNDDEGGNHDRVV